MSLAETLIECNCIIYFQSPVTWWANTRVHFHMECQLTDNFNAVMDTNPSWWNQLDTELKKLCFIKKSKVTDCVHNNLSREVSYESQRASEWETSNQREFDLSLMSSARSTCAFENVCSDQCLQIYIMPEGLLRFRLTRFIQTKNDNMRNTGWPYFWQERKSDAQWAHTSIKSWRCQSAPHSVWSSIHPHLSDIRSTALCATIWQLGQVWFSLSNVSYI